jgi:hypothetical protein
MRSDWRRFVVYYAAHMVPPGWLGLDLTVPGGGTDHLA